MRTEVIAEMSGNHCGKLEYALDIIELAAWAGADTIKFQCYDPERVVARRRRDPYIAELLKAYDEPYLDLVKRNWTPWDWFPQLIEAANDHKLAWLSSVFDPKDVEFLETLDCPRYKISAFEMTAWDVIKAVEDTGKDYFLSVRSTPRVTVMNATRYDGGFVPLGLSAHAPLMPDPDCPVVEWHLMIDGTEPPDKDFSLTPTQMAGLVDMLRGK